MVSLEKNNLDRLLQSLKGFADIQGKEEQIMVELCKVAVNVLNQTYSSAAGRYHFFRQGDKTATTEQYENTSVVTFEKSATGYSIVASGKDVCFFEFGTGVAHNSPPTPRPSGISNIGSFGKGQGSNSSWKWHVNGTTYITSGIPAQAGFPKAIDAIMAQAGTVIQKVMQ